MTTYHSVDIELIERRFDKPLGGSGVMGVDVITATVTDSAGVAGLGFTYVIGGGGGLIATLAEALAERFLTGQEIRPPAESWATIQKSFNRTGDGPNVLALGALDVANWDLKAKQENVPLAVALEGTVTDVPVYASGGFSPAASPEEMAEHALTRLEEGYRAIKPRVNAVPEDAQVIEAVRRAVGDDVDIMVDANEKGTVETAMPLLASAAAQGVVFVEEPLKASDPLGYRQLGALSNRPALATGEHLQGLDRFATVLEDGYAAYIQPDLAMAGGLSPILQVARMAAAKGVTVAPHFLPGLFVHLQGAFAGQLLLEEFPLVESVFEGWPEIKDGTVRATDLPGHGLTIAR